MPETRTPSPPSALVSLARLEVVDLRFETQDLTPDELGTLADRVDKAIDRLVPPIGAENVLIGVEKLASRFQLELPDAALLEADILAMADWPADRWMAAFRRIWADFRSGWSRFPSVGDFRAVLDATPAPDASRRMDDLRRLSSRLRQEQSLRARTLEQRRRVREREEVLYGLPTPERRIVIAEAPVREAQPVASEPETRMERARPTQGAAVCARPPSPMTGASRDMRFPAALEPPPIRNAGRFSGVSRLSPGRIRGMGQENGRIRLPESAQVKRTATGV
ncbi:hypothetical protein [Azospirillum sp.]|uniref:hypothetical protein n=1 Tax=Azospirillum sp. TaxID=34012 RepID=UPI00261F34C9|nr:hypothetical protein [Azospirillum sp.]